MSSPVTMRKSYFPPATIVAVVLAVLVALSASPPAQAQYSVIYTFTGAADGAYPNGPLVQDETGNFYGTTQGDTGTIFELTPAGVLTTLHTFNSDLSEGRIPEAGLFRDPDGILYGTATEGGAAGFGTIFKMDTASNFTVLHSFGGPKAADGSFPNTRLVSVDGKLYGTTKFGATDACKACGIVFDVTKGGLYKVFYRFTHGPGFYANGLSRDAAGNLYGTVPQGTGFGTVFKLDSSHTLTALYTFGDDGSNGMFPAGRVLVDVHGNIHGTTKNGGQVSSTACSDGCGVVFRIDPTGAETVIHQFYGGGGGSYPVAGLLDVDGVLYGTTQGVNCSCGTLFEIGKTGHYSVLHTFTGGPDGGFPVGELILGLDGSIYGVAQNGGNGIGPGAGVIFKYTP
jgi:uncharacterized repeat protein (TIGR03803 family)